MSPNRAVLSLLAILTITCTAAADYLQIHQQLGVGPSPIAIASADFDGDGFMDLAVGDDQTTDIYVFSADGHGNFDLLNVTDGGQGALTNMYSWDLDADQDMDLVLCSHTDEFRLLFNNGDGTFSAPVVYSMFQPESACTADLNNDGNLDLVVASGRLTGFINYYAGNGDGSFQDPVQVYDETRVNMVTTDDLDGDGDFDLAFSSQSDIKTMLGNGDGSFAPAVMIGTMNRWDMHRIRTADFTNDGAPDLLFTFPSVDLEGRPWVVLNNGDGTFQSPVDILTGFPYCVDAIPGDFDMDGDLDICVIEASAYLTGGYAFVMKNSGEGDFSEWGDMVRTAHGRPSALASGDFDFDGDLDIAFTSDSLIIVENTSMPLEFTMTPNPAYPTVPPGGGTFTFAVTLTNNSSYNLVVRGQTEAVLPNGNTVQDYLRNGLQLNAGATLQFNTLPVQVPAIAPPGDYRYWGIITVTNPPVQVQVRDHFDFEKLSGE